MEEEGESGNKDYYVQVRIPYLLSDPDVDSGYEAGEEAFSRMTEKLEDAGKDYIEVSLAAGRCHQCREPLTDVVQVNGVALVALMAETTVYNAESRQHAVDVLGTEIDEVMNLRSLEAQTVEEVEGQESSEKVES